MAKNINKMPNKEEKVKKVEKKKEKVQAKEKKKPLDRRTILTRAMALFLAIIMVLATAGTLIYYIVAM